jgi:hypothetical protein
MPCHVVTQNKEAESMTSITKNEKLTKWQKIFAREVTIGAFGREKALPPRKSMQRSRQASRHNQRQHNNGGEQRKLQIGTHQFFSF